MLGNYSGAGVKGVFVVDIADFASVLLARLFRSWCQEIENQGFTDIVDSTRFASVLSPPVDATSYGAQRIFQL